MTTLTPSESGPSSPFLPARPSFFRRMIVTVPTFFVLVGLAAVAYWGHETGWKIKYGQRDVAQQGRAHTEEIRPVVRLLPSNPRAERQPLPGQNIRIEFGSARDTNTVGIDIASVWPTKLTEQIAAGGEVMFDPSRIAKLSSRAGGVTRRVFKTAGDPVRVGEVLALLDSADVGRAKSEFQQALVQVRLRERRRDDLVGAKTVTSEVAIREAEAALKESDVRLLAASQALTNLGLTVQPADYRGLTTSDAVKRMRFLGVEDASSRLDAFDATANLLPIRASFTGIVLNVDIVAGEVVEAGKALFVIVDPTRMWVTLHLSPEEAVRVAAGQNVFYRPDGTLREFPGAVKSVGSVVDETTRTVPIRAEFENDTGSLRASTLGRGHIVLREVPNAVVVPHDSVQSFRGSSVVFVRHPDFLKPDGPKAFDVRLVTIGGKDERNTEIVAGLSQGEIVAAKGSDLLLTELTRAMAKR